jgi:hypothetical protein
MPALNQVKQCKSYPTTDIYIDHNLVILESQLCSKTIKKAKQEPRWDSKLLAEMDNGERFAMEIDGKLSNVGERSSKKDGMN